MAVMKIRAVLALLFACICSAVAVGQTPFLSLSYKEYAAGTIYERHFAEYDIIDAALSEAWKLAEGKEYEKAHEVLAAAIAKLFNSPKTPRYIEERAIEENYLGLLIVADSGLSFAQGKVQEAFNKLYAGDTLVSYSFLLEPAHRGKTVDPGFLSIELRTTPEDAVRFCFMATRMWLLEGSLEVKDDVLLVAPIYDFQLYFDEKWKCFDKTLFERDLRWYLDAVKDFIDYVGFMYKDGIPETTIFKKLVDEASFIARNESGPSFGINVVLNKNLSYKFIEQYYGLR